MHIGGGEMDITYQLTPSLRPSRMPVISEYPTCPTLTPTTTLRPVVSTFPTSSPTPEYIYVNNAPSSAVDVSVLALVFVAIGSCIAGFAALYVYQHIRIIRYRYTLLVMYKD